MGIDFRFRVNIYAPRPPILKVKVLKWPPVWGICFNAKESGFPVQPDEKIRKNRVFWSTYRESSYHTFDNSVVRHIPHFFQPHVRTNSWIFSWLLNLAITAFEDAWNNSYWWKIIQLLKVWKEFQSITAFEDTWKNSYWWLTIQLFKVREEIQFIR